MPVNEGTPKIYYVPKKNYKSSLYNRGTKPPENGLFTSMIQAQCGPTTGLTANIDTEKKGLGL